MSRCLNVSNAAAYKYESKLRKELPPEAYESILSPQQIAARKRQQTARGGLGTVNESTKSELKLKLRLLEKRLGEMHAGANNTRAYLSTSQIGVIAEDFCVYKLRRNGYDVYRTGAPSPHDLLVMIGNRPVKAQVKGSQTSSVALRRILGQKNNTGPYVKEYSRSEVDLFVVVDILRENIFFIPFSMLKRFTHHTITPGGSLWEFLDRYDLIEESVILD